MQLILMSEEQSFNMEESVMHKMLRFSLQTEIIKILQIGGWF